MSLYIVLRARRNCKLIPVDQLSVSVDSYHFENLTAYEKWNPNRGMLHIAGECMPHGLFVISTKRFQDTLCDIIEKTKGKDTVYESLPKIPICVANQKQGSIIRQLSFATQNAFSGLDTHRF